MKLPKPPCLLLMALVIMFFTHASYALPTPISSNKTAETAPLNRTAIERRDCKAIPGQPGQYDCDMNAPSLSQIISHMLDPAYGGTVTESSRAVFYTNLNRPNHGPEPARYMPWVMAWMRHPSNHIDEFFTTFDVGPSWYNAQATWIAGNAPAIQQQMNTQLSIRDSFALCYFEALALAAIHPTSYIFTREGQQPSVTSVWNRVEFPALTRNPRIKEIYRVDPRPPEERGLDPQDPANCQIPQPELFWSRDRGDPIPAQAWTCPWS